MRRLLTGLRIGFMFSFLTSAFSDGAEVRIIQVATGVNTDPPFVYGDYSIDSENPGITIEILHEIENRLGIRFAIVKHPWVRVVDEVKRNLIDGGFHFSYRENRRSFVAYPIPAGLEEPDSRYSISNRAYMLYQMNWGRVSWDGSNLTGEPDGSTRVGYIKGGSVHDVLKNQNVTSVALSTDWQLVQMLISGKIDAVVALENMMDTYIRRLPSFQQLSIAKEKLPVLHQAYYIGFSRQFYIDNRVLVWNIWSEIASMKASGFLSGLYEKYRDIRDDSQE